MAILLSCSSATNIAGALEVSGTMNYVPIEGGCWVLETGTDIKNKIFYELIGKNVKEVQIDKAVVKVRLHPRPDVATTCQMGTVAELLDIIEVKKPK